jgi:HK97 gp10 family phage protein
VKTSVKVDGLLDLDQALKEMADDLGKRSAKGAVRRALRAAAKPVHEAMVAGAPAHIKDSVEIGDRLTAHQAKLARTGQLTRSALELFVGVSYRLGSHGRTAHLFEFGTRSRVQKSTGRETGRISAMPFVRPAWDGNKLAALDILRKQLWVEIEKTTARARRKAERAAAKLAGK